MLVRYCNIALYTNIHTIFKIKKINLLEVTEFMLKYENLENHLVVRVINY
jgi:hypothetical protein